MSPRTCRPVSMLALAWILVVGVSACAPAGDGPAAGGGDRAPAAAPLDPESWHLVDLTHALGPDSLYWPNGEPFHYERQVWGPREDGQWYAMGKYSTPEHLGTHLDAPVHFSEHGWTDDQIPVDHLIGPAVVIDLGERVATDPDATLEPADIDAWEAEHGRIPAGAIVLVRTGWSSRWPDWNRYYGSDDPFDTTSLHFPGVSAAAAEVVAERGATGIGIDTASIDPGPSQLFEAHRVLGGAGLFNLENLTGLEALPATGAVLLALPIKIEGGSGGQVRVVAILPS